MLEVGTKVIIHDITKLDACIREYYTNGGTYEITEMSSYKGIYKVSDNTDGNYWYIKEAYFEVLKNDQWIKIEETKRIKMIKSILVWLVITVVVGGALLLGLGSYQHYQAEKFIEANGGQDVRVLGSSDMVMCSHGIGLVVRYTLDNEEMFAPVCTDLFHDTELGQVKK